MTASHSPRTSLDVRLATQSREVIYEKPEEVKASITESNYQQAEETRRRRQRGNRIVKATMAE